MKLKKDDMIPFLTAEEITDLVSQLANQISRTYENKEIVVICPLKGSLLFMADLCRRITVPQVIDFVYVTSPKGESCRIVKDISVDIQGRHVLIVEEIVDAGRTLSFLKARILASFPASLRIAALLDKPARRELPISLDFVGRQIDDRFVIGYGMDSDEKGRNYRDIFNFAQ